MTTVGIESVSTFVPRENNSNIDLRLISAAFVLQYIQYIQYIQFSVEMAQKVNELIYFPSNIKNLETF